MSRSKLRSRAQVRASAVRLRTLSCALLACGSLAACSTKGEPTKQPAKVSAAVKHGLSREQAEEALVVIGDSTITVGDFAEQLADKSPYLRARYTSPERRRELLEELVKFELLAKEATRRGLDESTEVQRTKRQLMVQQMMKAEFEEKVKLTDISDAEIKAYYEAHPGEFHKPAQVRASAIVVKDEAKAKRLLKQVLDKPEDDELFRELAHGQGDDPALRGRYGDLHFFSQAADRAAGDPTVPDAVAAAAFKLDKIGQVHPTPLKTEHGYWIVKLTGKRNELARTLEQTHRPIQHKLWREKREAAVEAFVASLRQKANIQENWALLESIAAAQPDNDAGASAPALRPERAPIGSRAEPRAPSPSSPRAAEKVRP
jgi:peptidyl-prolyl cis-trans isomerase C